MLTRDQILFAPDLQSEDVDVPEWGGIVRIRAMSGAQRDAWERSLAPKKVGDPVDVSNIRARLVAACAVGEGGLPLFTSADAAALGEKSCVALDRCVKVAQRLNAIGESDLEKAKQDFPSGQSDASTLP